MTKKEIRTHILSKRALMTRDEVFDRSDAIVEKIKHDRRYVDAVTVALFYPMRNEINLLSLLKDDKTFLFPRVEKDGIHFYQYQQDMHFIQSTFGVLEPDGKTKEYQDGIDYMLVPALAISDNLYRVGYGKGFYDRFVNAHRPKSTIGVIYDFQKINHFNHDPHDQQLDDYIMG